MCLKKYCECYQVQCFCTAYIGLYVILLSLNLSLPFIKLLISLSLVYVKKAYVGCSSGCRCENCKNVYGRKEGKKTHFRFFTSTPNGTLSIIYIDINEASHYLNRERRNKDILFPN